MSPMILMLVTFLAVAMAIMGIYSLVSDLYLRDRTAFSRRVDEEFRKKQRERVKRSTLFKNLAQLAREAGSVTETRLTLRQRFEAMVEQSGLELTPERLLLLMAGCGIGFGILLFAVFHSFVGGLAGFGIGVFVPYGYVSYRRSARMEKLLNQLPDALDLVARIIRAGQTMSQGLLAVADEFERPIAAEFAFCYEQQNLGLPPEVSLRDLAQRTGLLEMKILVLALLVQQQTGGNLSQLLENLAGVIRERLRMRGRIKALTAEGRMQALVLLALPPLMFLVMWLANPGYAEILLNYPLMLVSMGVLMLLGYLWIRAIVNFDF